MIGAQCCVVESKREHFGGKREFTYIKAYGIPKAVMYLPIFELNGVIVIVRSIRMGITILLLLGVLLSPYLFVTFAVVTLAEVHPLAKPDTRLASWHLWKGGRG
jgi:hypothetical protein